MNINPIVILVRPQLPENIGAAARAMSNFGLSELRLVAPREGWPHQRARETASGGEAVIDAAKAFPDFASATADIHLACATTARSRDMEKKVLAPPALVKALRTHKNKKIAFVFGPERTGLENEEIVLCDLLITIPTAPKHSSLNLAQSVAVLSYEWFMQNQKPSTVLKTPQKIAPKGDWQGLFQQLEDYLDQTSYFRVAHKKPLMWQNLQNMLLRANLNPQEVRTLRGMIRALWEKRQT